jgi:ubiquinone/menaquinone biosynthesis C-methylase UbiE
MARIDYNEVAPDYERGRGLSEDGLGAWRDALEPYLASLNLPLVDIGRGTGQFAPLFAGWFGIDVIGVEPSDGMRSVAAASNTSPRVTYLAGDAQHLPLAEGSCGAAWISTVIHHVPDLAAAALEIARVLAFGAPVLIRSAFPGRSRGISLFHYFPEAAAVVETFPSIEQVERDFGAAGFAFEGLSSIPQRTSNSLREVRERVGLRADTTLRGISDEAFGAGLARLDAEIAGGRGDEPVTDWLDLVVLRASS